MVVQVIIIHFNQIVLNVGKQHLSNIRTQNKSLKRAMAQRVDLHDIHLTRNESPTCMYRCIQTLFVKNIKFICTSMTYHRVCSQINMTGVSGGAGTACHSGAPGFTSGFSGVRVTPSVVLYVCFVDRCLSFCIYRLASVQSDSDCSFGIFKLFLYRGGQFNWWRKLEKTPTFTVSADRHRLL